MLTADSVHRPKRARKEVNYSYEAYDDLIRDAIRGKRGEADGQGHDMRCASNLMIRQREEGDVVLCDPVWHA